MEVEVGKTAGFCIGVQRAVDNCSALAKEQKGVYCLGEIVHNKEVIDDLKSQGITFIDNLEDVQGTVVIRAHGVPKEVYKTAEEKGITLKDFTCPNVLKIHRIAENYSSQGYYIFLCGNSKHPENLGTLSHCGQYVSVIENTDEDVSKALENFENSGIKKLLLISQTTYSLEKFYCVEKILKNNVKEDVDLEIIDTICKATELRQMETEVISKKVDYMIKIVQTPENYMILQTKIVQTALA